MKNRGYKYCVCRISAKEWPHIQEDINSRGYKNIRVIIPKIKLIERTRGGKDKYREVPLLFSYGFIKMSSHRAYDRQFLRKLWKQIPGITGWVHDLGGMHQKKIRRRIDNAEDWDDFSKVATVSKKEVRKYQRQARRNNIYSAKDIAKLTIGSSVTLRGYPFEGMIAEILEVNLTSKMVEVRVFTDITSLTIKLPFENLLYSIYRDYDEDYHMGYGEDRTTKYETLSRESLELSDEDRTEQPISEPYPGEVDLGDWGDSEDDSLQIPGVES